MGITRQAGERAGRLVGKEIEEAEDLWGYKENEKSPKGGLFPRGGEA